MFRLPRRLVVILLGCACAACGPAAAPQASATGPDASGAPTAKPAGAPVALRPIIEASTDPNAPTRVLDPQADQILREMSKALSALQTFALHAEESFDEIPSGQPRTMLTNIRRVAVQRPNRFVADAEGDSLNRSVWYDGRSISVLDKTTHTFSSVEMPGSIDRTLDALADQYGVEVPLADLLYSDPHAVLTAGATFSRYLGLHTAAGVPCHHLVFSQGDIEWQIWIDAGAHRLPRKLVITYVREPGEPQYMATFWAWRLSPTLPQTIFRFEAPEGAERVELEAFRPGLPGPPR
jgi:hypothetical protein